MVGIAADRGAVGRGSDDDGISLRLLANEALVGIDALRLLPRLPGIVVQRRARATRDVIVVPGWLTGDGSTTLLRAVLARDGHRVRGWERGRNHGDPRVHVRELTATVRRRATAAGQPVDLVGWSLGGVFARWVAAAAPGAVRRVVTLGTPLRGAEGTVFEQRGDASRRRPTPPPVPTTIVWSRRDGIVGWRTQLDDGNPWAEHVEVSCRHLALGLDPAVIRVVRDRVARDVQGSLGTVDDVGRRR